MTSFSEARFPTDIAYGMAGGPEYSTDVVIMASGFEQRNVNWQAARGRYNVAHGVKTEAQLTQIIAFFRAHRGKAIGFRFKDWTDYVGQGEVLGVGDGKTQDFQLIKHYAAGTAHTQRVIVKPAPGTVKLALPPELRFEVDYTSGMVHFVTPPPPELVIKADFEFDIPVRFDTDFLSSSLENYGSYGVQDIPLVEIK
jgi:uncharacterized protein (TIGR02217 family)